MRALKPIRRALALLVLAWSATLQAAGMGHDEARHLLLRTGFAPSAAEVAAYARLSRAEAVEQLLAETRGHAAVPPPAWVDEPIRPLRELRALSEEARRAAAREALQQGLALRAWWYEEMRATPSPLTERMTLFWHNHFATSLQKVKVPQLMYRQNLLLRRHALGNFAVLLHDIAKDPAMIIYLDGASNRRGQPNENFAREVMELFTLGAGHYTEQDIREAARAFTGWSLDRDTYAFRFYRAWHDDGEKVVLGRHGRFDGDAVLDILLAQPATAEWLSAKLWREFVAPEPDAAELRRLAQVLRAHDYAIKPWLRALLTSDAFYAARHRGVLIKSPVELLVGTVRQFGIEGGDARVLALAGRQLGQDLFAPPNVKGWPGGEHWINSTTLLARKQVLDRLFRAAEMPVAMPTAVDPQARRAQRLERALDGLRFDADGFFGVFPGAEPDQRDAIRRLVLVEAPATVPDVPDRLGYVHALVLDPAYQLK